MGYSCMYACLRGGVMGQISLLTTCVCVCVCLCVCVQVVISINLGILGPPTYSGQPCFLGLLLAIPVISWAFAHVQHGAR